MYLKITNSPTNFLVTALCKIFRLNSLVDDGEPIVPIGSVFNSNWSSL